MSRSKKKRNVQFFKRRLNEDIQENMKMFWKDVLKVTKKIKENHHRIINLSVEDKVMAVREESLEYEIMFDGDQLSRVLISRLSVR